MALFKNYILLFIPLVRENQQRQIEEKAEREKILRFIEENKRLEEEKLHRIKQSNLKYQQG